MKRSNLDLSITKPLKLKREIHQLNNTPPIRPGNHLVAPRQLFLILKGHFAWPSPGKKFTLSKLLKYHFYFAKKRNGNTAIDTELYGPHLLRGKSIPHFMSRIGGRNHLELFQLTTWRTQTDGSWIWLKIFCRWIEHFRRNRDRPQTSPELTWRQWEESVGSERQQHSSPACQASVDRGRR